MIRVPITNPKALTLGATGFMTAWAASNYSTDSHHLLLAAGAALAGSSVPHNPPTSPNVMPESHIITPYANNVE